MGTLGAIGGLLGVFLQGQIVRLSPDKQRQNFDILLPDFLSTYD